MADILDGDIPLLLLADKTNTLESQLTTVEQFISSTETVAAIYESETEEATALQAMYLSTATATATVTYHMLVRPTHSSYITEPYIRMGEIGTVGIWSPKTRSVPEFVHWAVRGPHAPSCPGRRAKKNWIWIFFLKNFEFVCFGPSRFGSSFRKKNPRRLRTSASARKRRWIFPRSADQYRRH